VEIVMKLFQPKNEQINGTSQICNKQTCNYESSICIDKLVSNIYFLIDVRQSVWNVGWK